jgi:hypothetical protein
MQLIKRIEFTGKNLNDMFSLPCVKAILKVKENPVLILYNTSVTFRSHTTVEIGDTMLQYDNGDWEVLK